MNNERRRNSRLNRRKRIKRKRRSRNFKIAAIGSTIILVVSIFIISYGLTQYNKLNRKSLSSNDSDLGISDETKELLNKREDKVTSLLVTGIDKDEDATDTMMVVAFNDTDKKIKLASLYRDTYVSVPEEQVPKLNYSHKYGGIPYTLKVINDNFKIDMRDYVSVDINGFFQIIDVMDGISIDVPSEDIYAINKKIDYVCKTNFQDIDSEDNYLTKGGKQILNTVQTMAFVRYRTSTGDPGRTGRTSEFLNAVISKVKAMPKTQYLELYDKIAPYIETTLGADEMLNLAQKAIKYSSNTIKSESFPKNHWDVFITGDYSDGEGKPMVHKENWNYFDWDKDETIEEIHDFLYD